MSPPLAVLATLALILLVPRRIPLWASFLAACLLLPLLAGKSLAESGSLWASAATSADTWMFTGVCAGVFVLSSILTHGGHLAVLCDFASALIPSRRFRAAVMPALVGLVPMPGGAVVSAPLIDRSLGSADVSATDKNLINYWFRHVWEVSWPLYPSVLLALGYVEGDEDRFLVAQACLTVVLAVAGYWALLRRVPGEAKGGPGTSAMPPRGAARAFIPLLVLIALPMLFRVPGMSPGVSLLLGNAVAILAALLTTIDLPGLRKVPVDGRIYAMTALAFLVKVFGDLVASTGAAASTAQMISEAGVAPWVSVLLLPFFVGFASGNTLTFVTIAFPIVMPALTRFGIQDSRTLSYVVLGYAGGFVGYLTSPVHMCLVLSTRYFNSKLVSAYARLAIPILIFLAAAAGLFIILSGRVEP
jgi:integral membrane protein (TIGR00529 family)